MYKLNDVQIKRWLEAYEKPNEILLRVCSPSKNENIYVFMTFKLIHRKIGSHKTEFEIKDLS